MSVLHAFKTHQTGKSMLGPLSSQPCKKSGAGRAIAQSCLLGASMSCWAIAGDEIACGGMAVPMRRAPMTWHWIRRPVEVC